MDDLGTETLIPARRRGHPHDMGARRRAAPAAIAAALFGLCLVLYRPQRMPELRPGPRRAPPSAAVLAAAIAWTPPSGLAVAREGSGGRVMSAPTNAEDVSAGWRDALADRPFPSGTGAASSSSAAARRDRVEQRSPAPAQADPVPAPASNESWSPNGREDRAAATPRRETPVTDTGQELPRGAPLAHSATVSDEWADADEAVAREGDPSQNGGGPAPTAGARRRARAFPLFRPPRRLGASRIKTAAARRVRPPLLSKLLGRDTLRPPPASIEPPDLSRLKGRKPPSLPDGSPVPALAFEPSVLETLDPSRTATACRRAKPHWDDGPLWHDGAARGLTHDARWLWLWKDDSRWWAVSEPEYAPLLRHQELWWGKKSGVWFALHDGELWSWRRFADWNAHGLLRLTDGVELVYSADFKMVAVITPGEGAVLYDAASGAELGAWLESELPRRRPRAPAELRLPRGI